MPAMLPDAVVRFGAILVELLLLFVAISFVLALVQRRWVTPERLRRTLGGRGRLLPLLEGAGLGALTPFCSCAGVPVLAGLLRARVRFGTSAAFLLASPLLNPVLLGVVVLLFGGQVAVVYAAVVLPTTILLAAGWEAAGLDAHVKVGTATPAKATPAAGPPAGGAAACDGGTCHPAQGSNDAGQRCDETPGWRGWPTELAAAGRESIGTLRPVLAPLLAAVTAGALIYGMVPEATIARVAGEGTWLAVPVAALIGIPLYVRGEAALPIGYALLAAGAGVGPVFAMVVAAAGASLPEVMLLTGLFRRRLLVAFVASVLTVAVAAGYLIPLVA